ncbi:hypothetical protein Tco_1548579 [Tanacetum coccineum]
MANMEFCDKHNIVAFLQKLTGNEEFHQIVYFLTDSHIKYALTANPTIYVSLIEQFWKTATVNTVNDGEQQITVIVDGHKFAITEASVRRHLQLADPYGLSSLPNTEIFEQLTLMGYVSNDDILTFKKGKDNGENIMKSINEGPFHMGTVSDVIAGGTEGAVQQGPVRARVLNDLSAEEKERYKADIRATNILLQGIPKDIYLLINHYTNAKDIWENVKLILEGSELTKDDRESQLNNEFEHFRQIKGETIQGY